MALPAIALLAAGGGTAAAGTAAGTAAAGTAAAGAASKIHMAKKVYDSCNMAYKAFGEFSDVLNETKRLGLKDFSLGDSTIDSANNIGEALGLPSNVDNAANAPGFAGALIKAISNLTGQNLDSGANNGPSM